MSETFSGVQMVGPEAQAWYAPANRERFKNYLASIVVPQVLMRTLAPDFLHIDGSLALRGDEPPRVGHVMATQGRDSFIGIFRNMVNGQIKPHGTVEGTWISPRAYRPIEEAVIASMDHTPIRGALIGAGAVRFPYVLRPGGQPLDLPPPFYGLLRDGEQPFTPLSATGNEEQDRADVNVIQAVYGTPDEITARIGLVWGTEPRAVPFTLHEEITARRTVQPVTHFTHDMVAHAIQRFAPSAS